MAFFSMFTCFDNSLKQKPSKGEIKFINTYNQGFKK